MDRERENGKARGGHGLYVLQFYGNCVCVCVCVYVYTCVYTCTYVTLNYYSRAHPADDVEILEYVQYKWCACVCVCVCVCVCFACIYTQVRIHIHAERD